jgi:GR25 family glycosyltransferase involved in LPS biosynthesis
MTNYNYDYYVIHLCKDQNRINNVKDMYKKIGREVNIFKGIDALSFQSHDYNKILKSYDKDLKLNFTPPYAGIIGCYLSHYLLLKSLLNSNLDYAVIFEDDSNIAIQNLDSEIDNILKEINETTQKNTGEIVNPIDFDFIFIGYNYNTGIQYKNNFYYNTNDKLWGFHGYIVNIKSITKILNLNKIINYEIDIQIYKQIQKNDLIGLFLKPKLIFQHNFTSLIRKNAKAIKTKFINNLRNTNTNINTIYTSKSLNTTNMKQLLYARKNKPIIKQTNKEENNAINNNSNINVIRKQLTNKSLKLLRLKK